MARKEFPLRGIVCAVDPGTATGVALWARDKKKSLFVGNKTFYSMQLFLVRSIPDRSQVTVLIEHPPRIVYGRNNPMEGEMREDLISKCGGVRREAELLHLCLTERGYQCFLVTPVRGTKWPQWAFDNVMGSHRQMNEHTRDALRLAIYHADNDLYQQIRLRVKAREENGK